MEDQLAAYEAFRSYRRHGLDAQLQYYKGGQLPQDLQKWVFTLCKGNMQVRSWHSRCRLPHRIQMSLLGRFIYRCKGLAAEA